MRGLLILIALLISVIPAIPLQARADEAADREDAGHAFAAGQAADRQRDWTLAIQHYIRANDLVPHPNAMFNIATDYERLGKLREAAVWYQRYIEAAPDAPDHAKIVQTLREITTRPTTLTVRTIPAGARVLVDGEYVGTSPYTGKIKGGQHQLTFEHDGQREQRAIAVEFGEPAVLDLTLRGESGRLRVIGTPLGATVTVDDMPAGTVPAELDLAPGPHAIHITAYGHAPFDTTADIQPGRDTVLRANLPRALGGIDTPRTIRAGYLLGVGGGADLKGEGALALADLGIQALRYDLTVRVGKAAGLTAIDFVVRWAMGQARFAPYIGAGFGVAVDNRTVGQLGNSPGASAGYLLTAGLRYELSKGDHAVFALVVESGLRYFPGLAVTDGTGNTRSATLFPLMASLQVVYR